MQHAGISTRAADAVGAVERHLFVAERYRDAGATVIGYEIDDAYAEAGRRNLRRAHVPGVEIRTGNGLEQAFASPVDLIYLTASGDGADRAPIVSCLRDGGILQTIRPLSEQEFESEPDVSWLKGRFRSHASYRRDEWREYCCLAALRRDGDGFSESSRLYNVSFVPLLDRPLRASVQPVDPFAGLAP